MAAVAHAKGWGSKHAEGIEANLYPTEWLVRVLAGGNYPRLKLDKSRYAGGRIVDFSCGDGRNLALLQDLGFEVHATEISQTSVDRLRATPRYGHVRFEVARNGHAPYPDAFFDYVVACGSCYYLDEKQTFLSVLEEVSRILKPGGAFIGNVPDHRNFLAQGGAHNPDGTMTIGHDPYGLRNGQRLMFFEDAVSLEQCLRPFFSDLSVGSFNDDYFGIVVAGLLFVGRKPT